MPFTLTQKWGFRGLQRALKNDLTFLPKSLCKILLAHRRSDGTGGNARLNEGTLKEKSKCVLMCKHAVQCILAYDGKNPPTMMQNLFHFTYLKTGLSRPFFRV